jgi:hypothetical protein
MELLIATVVFSVVLLLVTAGILQITRVYYKGVTESNTQNTARAIIDSISQSIQFSGQLVTETPATAPPAGANRHICVGGRQFSYQLGSQVENSPTGANQVYHALTVRPLSGCSTSSTADTIDNQTAAGRDLIGRHMRLSNLSIRVVGTNQYRVTVRVVYGDNDLLNNPTATNATCRTQAGSQFCAVSELSTIVVKRVE